jgi:hypothetical protein
VINKATNAPVGTWTLSDPSDIIGVTVGGNRYGWFVQNEIDDLAIDNSERTGLISTENCEVMISDGGWITAAITGDKATFGGNAKVSPTREATGEQVYQDHGPFQPITVKAETVEIVLCDELSSSAEVWGHASVDGSEPEYLYRIKLTDGGQGNNPSDMYGIVVGGYASGDQRLEGGNINIKFPAR